LRLVELGGVRRSVRAPAPPAADAAQHRGAVGGHLDDLMPGRRGDQESVRRDDRLPWRRRRHDSGGDRPLAEDADEPPSAPRQASAAWSPRGDLQALGGRGPRDQGRGRQRQQHAGVPGPGLGELLGTVFDPADHERRAEDQQQVGQHRADQRGLHHGEQSGLQREEGDEQLREVAQRALQHAGRARAEAFAELLDAASDQRGEQRHGDGRTREREDSVGVGIVGDTGQHDEDRAADEDDEIRTGQNARAAGRAAPSRRHADYRLRHVWIIAEIRKPRRLTRRER